MDILERVRTDLKGATLARQNEVADAAGVPWGTLRKIVDRKTGNPRYDTVERLRKYYDGQSLPAADPQGQRPPVSDQPADPVIR